MVNLSNCEVISKEDTLGHYSFAEGWEGSPYGDPELALLDLEKDPEAPAFTEAQVANMRRLCGLLLPVDRILLTLHHNRLTQEVIGNYCDLTQVGVCNRLATLKKWLVTAIEREPVLETVRPPESPHLAHVWHRVVWHHETTMQVARDMGAPQTTVYDRWHRSLKVVLESATDEQADVVMWVRDHISLWHRPRRSNRPRRSCLLA